jgi:membrane fusion protein (multidrug efflux system)
MPRRRPNCLSKGGDDLLSFKGWCVTSWSSAGVAAVCLAAAAMALTGCGAHRPAGAPDHGPAEVGVFTLRAAPITLTTELPGRTSAYEVSDVRPQVSGIITARLFTEGGEVKAGQLLYRIEPAPYQAAYDQAKAALANAAANLTTTKLKAQRYADLVKINAVAKQDYDDARAAYGQAQANVEQQRAATAAARINLDFTRVTAPISGRIGRSSVTPGALVTASQATALATIQRLDPIYVDLTQSADEVLKLRRDIAAGQIDRSAGAEVAVRLKLDDGSQYPLPGRLQFTDVTVDQTSGAVTLRAVFPNPRGLLLPGLYVQAVVAEGVDPNGLLAPQEGVGRDQKGQPTVLIVDSRGRVQLRQIKAARAVGPNWLVTQGLAPGDRLIIQGLQSAKPGALVHAVAAVPPSRAPGAPAPGPAPG